MAKSALLLSFVATLGIVQPFAPAHASRTSGLTFEERVSAQQAIERVYFRHQVGGRRLFDETVPRRILEAKVSRSLAESRALREVWGTPVDADMLREELNRIAHATRMPARLQELYDALGNDSVLIQETLVREALVGRLARQFFEADAHIHEASRREAEALHEGLARGAIDPHAADSRRRVVTIEKAGTAAMRAVAPAAVGEPGPVRERDGAWTIDVVLEEDEASLVVATYRIPRLAYDQWLVQSEMAPGRDAPRDEDAVAEPVPLPAMNARADWSPSESALREQAAACPADDIWSPYLPVGRDQHTAIWTGTEMIIWGGHNYDSGVDITRNDGGRYDPVLDQWRPLSSVGAPPPAREHAAVWTGTRMIVWGGYANRNGGQYDPATDTWTPITTSGAPNQTRCKAAWTGQVVLMWCDVDGPPEGARYDPDLDSWTPISTLGAPGQRNGASMAWTGSAMIVWGGIESGIVNTGAAYHPDTDTWTPVTTTGAPTARYGHSAVWGGSRMIVWGGRDDFNPMNTGGLYDPAKDKWTAMSLTNAPSVRFGHPAIWTGSEMIVWGGFDTSASAISTGGRYDPGSNSWTAIPDTFSPDAGHTLVWTGNSMLVFGGQSSTVKRYTPSTGHWGYPTPAGAPTPLTGQSAIWTGSLAIFWGGYQPVTNQGWKYDPALDVFAPTTTNGAPSARYGHAAVWTGSEMIIWGGNPDPGGRYDPVADTWRTVPQAGGPGSRGEFSATWSGGEMIIWGGSSYTSPACCAFNTGAAYSPSTDTWRTLPTAGAPIARGLHAAVWTGSEMIVWGGYYRTLDFRGQIVNQYQSNGGRYNPATNLWSPMSLAGAPSARRSPAAFWTGGRVIVWGGDAGAVLNTGGRYDPLTDTWSPTSAAGAPPAVAYTAAHWSGREMVIWGQSIPSFGVGNGRRYDPGSDSWAPTSVMSAPLPGGTSVWIGDAMLVWSNPRLVSLYHLEPDVDGDGFTVCAGDCDDAAPAVHPGAAEACNGLDDDCNAIVDDGFDADADGITTCAGDCNDSDPGAWSVPVEVGGFAVGVGVPLPVSWNDPGAASGPGTRSELISGLVPDLASGGCLYVGLDDGYADPRPDPSPGAAYWYLVRARNSCGSGTLGTPQRDQQVGACP